MQSKNTRRARDGDKENDPSSIRTRASIAALAASSASRQGGHSKSDLPSSIPVCSTSTLMNKRRKTDDNAEEAAVSLTDPLPPACEEGGSPDPVNNAEAKFMEEVRAALDFSYKSKKHNFGARMRELETHVRLLREVVMAFNTRKDALLRHASHLQNKVQADMDLVAKLRVEGEGAVAAAKAALTQEQNARHALQVEKEMKVEHLTQQLHHAHEAAKAQIMELKSEAKSASEVRVLLEVGVREAELAAGALRADVARLSHLNDAHSATIAALNLEVRELQTRMAAKGEELSLALASFDRNQAFNQERIAGLEAEKRELVARAEAERREAMAAADRDRDDAKARYDLLLADKGKVEVERETAERLLSESRAQAEAGERACVGVRAELEAIKLLSNYSKQEQLESLCKLSLEAECLRRQLEGKENLAEALCTARQALLSAQRQLFDSEQQRRALHNRVQELKGNIRVMARVRPALPAMDDAHGHGPSGDGQGNADADANANANAIDCVPDGRQLRINVEGKDHSFSFDQVFPPASSQAEIFEEVSQLVQSALDGHDVCLFSYGQTGSGKTHTMQGQGPASGPHAGIIPRAIQKVIEEARRLEKGGWNFSLEATFCEIYMENVYDLLAAPAQRKALDIKMEDQTRTHVPGLSRVLIKNEEHIESLLATANKARSVAATNMNERSSRSHSVFTLHCTGMYPAESVAVRGTLNLVDLAGSERVSKSGVEGEELAVTQSINKSLSALALVFNSLSHSAAAAAGPNAQTHTHIPFRNSKLTYLLQHCFSTSAGKTLMFVNLAPAASSAAESLCSLRFAQNVNNTAGRRQGPPPKRIERVPNPNPTAEAVGESPSAAGGQCTPTRGASATAARAPAAGANNRAATNRLAVPKRK